MFLAADGQDGNGIQLEKVESTVFKLYRWKLVVVCSPFENSLDISLLGADYMANFSPG